MAYNLVFRAYGAILNSSFHAYSAIVDSFVIAFFMLRNNTFRSIGID